MARHYFSKESDLSWDVTKSPVTVNSLEVPTHYALVRNDNKALLQIHKNSYNPYMNKDFRGLMDTMQKITGFENMSFQEYKNGNVVLGYLENTQNVKVNGLNVNKYLVLGNSHDGSKGIFLGTSEVMLRCMNQFGRIIKNNVIKHTKNNSSKIDELKSAYEVYFRQVEMMDNVYKKMSKVNIDKELMDSLTKRLFDSENEEKLSTRKSNLIIDFNSSVQTETKDLGENLFGYLNAVTHYTTHKMKGDNVFGNLFGSANKMNQKALEMTLELV